MAKCIFTLISLSFLLSCTQTAPNYDPAQRLDAVQQKEVLASVIRYAAKLPGKGNLDNRMDSQWDTYYAEQAEMHRLDLYSRNDNTGDIYLMISRIAPSLKIKRVAIGIHLRMEGDSLTYYNEVFRTWKMEEDVLAQKGAMLFDLMVKGKDLSPYYPQNSGKEEYIEFPDEHTRFDAKKRVWVSDRDNPLAPYYELKQN